MQILIGCAKTMTDGVSFQSSAFIPHFLSDAKILASELACYSAEELQDLLDINPAIARQNWFRYQNFGDAAALRPAISAYDGIVFKKIEPQTLSADDLQFAQSHLFIASFLYGLLRPLDAISPYRLEGKVELPASAPGNLFDYWQPRLTDWFISRIKADDGVLVNLASNEFRNIFDWKKVKKELTVISPDFKMEKDGKPRTVVVYAKMCRGAMTRWIIKNRPTDPSDLLRFNYEGFTAASSDYTFIL